jgi:hypothetical protein
VFVSTCLPGTVRVNFSSAAELSAFGTGGTGVVNFCRAIVI